MARSMLLKMKFFNFIKWQQTILRRILIYTNMARYLVEQSMLSMEANMHMCILLKVQVVVEIKNKGNRKNEINGV